MWTLVRQKRIEGAAADRLKGHKPIAIKRALLPPGQSMTGGQDVWVLNPADRDSVLQPRVGDRFLMSLPDHGSSGFLWGAHEAQAAGYTLRPLPVEPAQGEQVWVGGAQQVLFEVEVGGRPTQVQLDLQERQPWKPTAPAADKVKLVAQFETIDEGLSPQTKKHLIAGFRG